MSDRSDRESVTVPGAENARRCSCGHTDSMWTHRHTTTGRFVFVKQQGGRFRDRRPGGWWRRWLRAW